MKIVNISLSLIICLSIFASFAEAARKETQILKAGSEIKTNYFSCKVPDGWMMPNPPKKQPNGGIAAIYTLTEGNLAVSLNIVPGDVNVPDYIAKMTTDMRKQGLIASTPKEIDGFYHISIAEPHPGQGWFKSEDGIFSVTMIFGNNMARANKLLQALKPSKPGLFPASVN